MMTLIPIRVGWDYDEPIHPWYDLAHEASLEELALLTLGARKWVQITEAQGVELSPAHKDMLDNTKALVERLQA